MARKKFTTKNWQSRLIVGTFVGMFFFGFITNFTKVAIQNSVTLSVIAGLIGAYNYGAKNDE